MHARIHTQMRASERNCCTSGAEPAQGVCSKNCFEGAGREICLRTSALCDTLPCFILTVRSTPSRKLFKRTGSEPPHFDSRCSALLARACTARVHTSMYILPSGGHFMLRCMCVPVWQRPWYWSKSTPSPVTNV